MNYTNLFYYFTIADNIHVMLVVISVIAATLGMIALMLWINCHFTDDYGNASKFKKRAFFGFLGFSVFLGLVLAVPDENDTVLLISGTAVGVVLDTTNVVDEISVDIVRFLRERIQYEAEWADFDTKKQLKILSAPDSLQQCSKEELIEIIEAFQTNNSQ